MQQDCQTLYAHPSWQQTPPGEISAAWYQREITVPASWAGRRITIQAEYVNSLAVIFIDDQPAGELRFPAGEVDVTALCPSAARIR